MSTPSPKKRVREMKYSELKDECRKMRRKVTGCKADLCERLEEVLERNDRGYVPRGSQECRCLTFLASGEQRHVYEGEYTKGPRKGQAAVDKVFKTGSVYENKFFEHDINAVAKAAFLIRAFNQHNDSLSVLRPRFYLNKPEVWSEEGSGKLGLIEPKIEGQYIKFNSNTGWVRDQSSLTEALSHFSYAHTNGDYLLCDVQGSCSDGKYVLTDPCVHSLTGEFGATDGGLDAMKSFFSRHRCNHYCQYHWQRAAPYGGVAAHPARSGTSFFPARNAGA